jgi:PAS domain-containing protein
MLEGRWFLMRIRLYRTTENAIMGLVITFSDITTQKTVQDQLHLARDYAQNIIATIREALIVLNPLFQIVSASRSFYRMFQLRPESTEGKSIYDINDKKWDIPQLRELLEQILPEHNAFEDYLVMYDFPILGQRSLMLNAKQIYNVGGNPELILLAFEDVTNALPK